MPEILKRKITRSVTVARTARVQQMGSIFDVPPASESVVEWDVELQVPEQWSVGVIAGKSGDGKTTVARELFGDNLVAGWDWPKDQSLLDGFPKAMSIKDIVALLSSVGFSSPPAWVRPFHVLSNGQQFRVNLARTLAEQPDLAVVDEFSSVVDRTVAQIGSAAVAKTVRRRGGKFIAVTCHYDVIDWLEPDWVYEPATNRLQLNVGPDGSRGSLWRRPKIELKIVRTDPSAWVLFKPHHYLDGNLHWSAKCFVGMVRDHPAVFTAVLSFPHPHKPSWREHRTVCLPDFQGVGIGNAMSEFVASLFVATGKPYMSTTSNPAMVRHRMKSALWKCTRKPGMVHMVSNIPNAKTGMASKASCDRVTAGFDYLGPARHEEARRFGLLPAPVAA